MLNWLLQQKLDRIGRNANPDRDFVNALEMRIKQEMGVKTKRPSAWKVTFGSLTSLALMFGGTGAYAYSSDAVLPDHPLYPVRETIEQTENVLAATPEQKAAIRLKHVKRRLKERLLQNQQHKPVTQEQMHQFVANMEATIEANTGLPEEERAEYDRIAGRIEATYTASLVNARDREVDEEEKKNIDTIIEKQTNLLDARVEKLQEKRKEHYRRLLERRQKLEEMHRLKIQDFPKLDSAQLRQLLPQRRIFRSPELLEESKETSPTTTGVTESETGIEIEAITSTTLKLQTR